MIGRHTNWILNMFLIILQLGALSKLSMDLIWWYLLNYFCFQNFFVVSLCIELNQLIFVDLVISLMFQEKWSLKYDFFWFYLSSSYLIFMFGILFSFWLHVRHNNWIMNFLFSLVLSKIITSFLRSIESQVFLLSS